MPRDGSNIYSQPFPDVVEDTTIESTVYNGFTNDVAQDLNTPRPIVAGGTGATNADQALFNLAAEKATQVVTNYDSHLWVPGSFRSAAGATGAPTVNAFAGTAIIGEALANPPTNQNVVLEARDLGDASVPGLKYIREKTAGVWSAWALDVGSQAIRYDADQNLTEVQKAQGRENVYAAPFDALSYNGMQINGSMDVSQENGSSVVAVAANTQKYIVDGWKLQTSGVQAFNAYQNAAGPVGFSNSLYAQPTITNVSPGVTDYATFIHYLEGYRILRLGFGTASAQSITIGFWVYSQRIGTLGVSVRNGAATRSYVFGVTINASTTWEYKTVTIPGDTTGTWVKDNTAGMLLTFAILSGSNYATAPNTWVAGNFMAPTGATNFAASGGDSIAITGVVVLPGIEAPSTARSPLIMRPYGDELLTCQRYLSIIQMAGTIVPVVGFTNNVSLSFPRSLMRVDPTITQPLVDVNFVHGGSPTTGNQWALLSPGVLYATKTGTCTFASEPTGLSSKLISIAISGMTLSGTVTYLHSGPGMGNLTADARL